MEFYASVMERILSWFGTKGLWMSGSNSLQILVELSEIHLVEAELFSVRRPVLAVFALLFGKSLFPSY